MTISSERLQEIAASQPLDFGVTHRELVEMASALLASRSGVGREATHLHKKRGSFYELLGFGKMQAEDWWKGEVLPDMTGSDMEQVDMREVAIYRSVDDGSLWVRPREEFEDGRFEALKDNTHGA